VTAAVHVPARVIELPDFEVRDLSVHFGGLIAVDHASLRASSGTVTALIGPNGAGKTTLFNASTGVVTAATGDVLLGGSRLNHESVSRRASRGLGRTFQRMELFNSMTVEENVRLGPEAVFSSRHPFGQIVARRHERTDIGDRALDAMERCGIVHLARRVAGGLSTGQRRLVELARAIASPFRFLLLDEPSSGLDHYETERFGEVLGQFVADTGMGVLLVEHDMALVAAICTYVYVLDFGRMIFSGATAETMQSEVVRRAYLGTDASSGARPANEEVG
jgi:ABC-type branched-subunit amino acid transport system ATPase component